MMRLLVSSNGARVVAPADAGPDCTRACVAKNTRNAA
jgi:hypothetical protein